MKEQVGRVFDPEEFSVDDDLGTVVLVHTCGSWETVPTPVTLPELSEQATAHLQLCKAQRGEE